MGILRGIFGMTIFLGLSLNMSAQCPPSGGGTFSGNLTITSSCTVTGNLELTNKNITISTGGSLTVNGSFLNSGNGNVTINGGTFIVTGSFENDGNGTVTVENDGTLDVGVDYTNGGNGTSDFISGTITIGGDYLNEGNGNIESGGVVQVGGNFTVEGNGTTTIDGGLSVGGTATLGSKGVDILDGGVLSATTVVSSGDIDVELGGTIYVESGSITGTVNNDPGNLDQDCTNNCCGNNCNTTGDNLNETATETLPIVLLGFTAKQAENSVSLQWSSAAEINNDYYTIERSYDGFAYEKVTDINGAGNSTEILEYEIQDYPEINGTVFYRLSQTDFDGTTEVFPVIYLEYNLDQLDLLVYPTVVSSGDRVHLKVNSEIKQIHLKCVGMDGKENQMPLSIGNGSINMDSGRLTPGIYLLTGTVNGLDFTERIIVKH